MGRRKWSHAAVLSRWRDAPKHVPAIDRMGPLGSDQRVPSVVGRRGILSGAGGLIGSALLPRAAHAVDVLPKLPLAPLIAGTSDAPAVTAAFLAEQLATANDLFAPAGMVFEAADATTLDAKFRDVDTRADRDALAANVVAREITVFFVGSLRDVDDPKNYRMGVTWRKLTDLKIHYIIVSAAARPTTMAHELGHFFGLDHTYVKNNLMSYDRDGGPVSMSDPQLVTVRKNAQGALARKDLVPR